MSIDELTITLNLGNVAYLLIVLSACLPSLAKYFYMSYRLIFGTLYPTYLSFKALKQKNDNECVSFFLLTETRHHNDSLLKNRSKPFTCGVYGSPVLKVSLRYLLKRTFSKTVLRFNIQARMMMYWIVFAIFTFLEGFIDIFVGLW